MNNELKLLAVSCKPIRVNKLSLNVPKTKPLIFRPGRKLNVTVPNIKLNNFSLAQENTVTYLGIEINENLSWNKQIEILPKKFSRTNGILSKLRCYVSKITLTSIYYSLFQSYKLCGSTVWSFTSQKKLEEDFCSSEKIYESLNIF